MKAKKLTWIQPEYSDLFWWTTNHDYSIRHWVGRDRYQLEGHGIFGHEMFDTLVSAQKFAQITFNKFIKARIE